MEEKELTQENQEQPVEQIDQPSEQQENAEVVDEKQEEQAEQVEVSEPEPVIEAAGEQEVIAEKEAEPEQAEAPVQETATVMPEDLIKKLQTQPTHRSKGMGSKKVMQGIVASNKADKTIIVKIETQVAHPLYKKYYKSTKKVMAHDENNDCNIGDVVRVKESRPLSARKRWVLTDIISRAK
jgi:small subunit ribosomal protein S17